MKDFISIGGQQIKLTKEQIRQLTEALGIAAPSKLLADFAVGDTVKIGGFEMVVLEQHGQETSLILKDLYVEETEFGENNNYDGSYVDEQCRKFALELAAIVGEENVVEHEVDLTSNDGLKCYGFVERIASLLTADLYRKYVDVLDTVKPDKWWWLATPWSTARHDNDRLALCVAPSGVIYGDDYVNGVGGVRPFCILKSSIFVSG
jgi:hypothetical protein